MQPATAATGESAAAEATPRQALDFRFEGVRIFHDPTAGAAVNGLGYPGQGLTDIDRRTDGEYYLCADGNYSLDWWLIRNNPTGVTGWIPGCNLKY